MLLVLGACGGSALRKLPARADGSVAQADASAVQADASADASVGNEAAAATVDADCTYVLGVNLPTDAGACMPVDGFGKIYSLDVGAGVGACLNRPTVPCEGACGPGPILRNQVADAIRAFGCLYDETVYAVTFSQGCADRLYLASPSNDPSSEAACVARALATARFACAEQVPCWQWLQSTLL